MSQAKTNPAKPSRSPAAGTSRTSPEDTGPFTLGRWWRRGISALLVVHLLLVIAVPLTMMRPRSRLADAVVSWTRPWIEMTQLSHGYGFFAPEVGPSHLVEYQLEFDPTEGKIREPMLDQFPDMSSQWPRLRYHRHFMLSEKLASYFQPQPYPPQRPSDDVLRTPAGAETWRLDQEAYQADLQQWRQQRQIFDLLVKSYAQHLLAENDASVVRMHLKVHLIPSPEAVIEGRRLKDPEFYDVPPESEVQVTKAEPPVGTEPSPEEIAPPGSRERSVAIPEERQ
jgi:hypothetical protein